VCETQRTQPHAHKRKKEKGWARVGVAEKDRESAEENRREGERKGDGQNKKRGRESARERVQTGGKK